MALHRMEPTQADTTNVFSAAHQPVVTVDSGDTIVVRSLDAAGYLERHEFPATQARASGHTPGCPDARHRSGAAIAGRPVSG